MMLVYYVSIFMLFSDFIWSVDWLIFVFSVFIEFGNNLEDVVKSIEFFEIFFFKYLFYEN